MFDCSLVDPAGFEGRRTVLPPAVSTPSTMPVTVSSVGCRRARPVSSDIAEAVEGRISAATFPRRRLFADIGVHGPKPAAQVHRVDHVPSVFSISACRRVNDRACWRGEFQAHDADHVLAELEGPFPGLGLGDRKRLDLCESRAPGSMAWLFRYTRGGSCPAGAPAP